MMFYQYILLALRIICGCPHDELGADHFLIRDTPNWNNPN